MTIALGRISRISFTTNLTRADAPTIALGFMLEAAWEDQARWLGLIGRLQLSPYEHELVNLSTWPELERPFNLMDRVFNDGWAANWGDAAVAVQNTWNRSALVIDTEDATGLLADASAESDVAWNATTTLLYDHLTLLGAKLTALSKPATTAVKKLPRKIVPYGGVARHPRRMQEDFALAAASL